MLPIFSEERHTALKDIYMIEQTLLSVQTAIEDVENVTDQIHESEAAKSVSKGYSYIYCDPPYRFRNWSMEQKAKLGEKWGRANGRPIYPCMNTEDIAALPVERLAARDSLLFLWATYPQLEDALTVMRSWGYKYKTCAFTWVKLTPNALGNMVGLMAKHGPTLRFLEKLFHFGLGYWTHANPEVCLLGTRGHPKRVDKTVPNLVLAPLGAHSAKPPVVRDRIVQLVGDLPRLELFARDVAPGWDAMGNELEGNYDIRDALTWRAAELGISDWHGICSEDTR